MWASAERADVAAGSADKRVSLVAYGVYVWAVSVVHDPGNDGIRLSAVFPFEAFAAWALHGRCLSFPCGDLRGYVVGAVSSR